MRSNVRIQFMPASTTSFMLDGSRRQYYGARSGSVNTPTSTLTVSTCAKCSC